MKHFYFPPSPNKALSPIHLIAEQAFSRTAGAPLIPGNSVRILKDAKENYPAWLDAMGSAKKSIHFESYIIHEDDIGNQFSELLAQKAREGVQVRLIYDWLGAFGKTSHRFWKKLREAGVKLRCFNPPRLDSPLGWFTRDHRKMIAVDGRIAFVTGLCVGRRWVGYPERSIEPWRDTGVEVRGPAVADIECAFAEVWATMGDPLPENELPEKDTIPAAGDITLRVVATVPNTAGLYRLDQLIAVLARRSLWLTDAYFVVVTPYLQALRSAAMDGVDVRLLVPGATDIPVLRGLSRAGYQPLLESGVRIFEWNGPMMHAKTAVADGRWARVGSTNLNLSSWIGNYELDIAVEDERFAQAMEEMYIKDLEHSTEVVLSERHRVRFATKRPRRPLLRPGRLGGGSVSRVGAGAIRISNTVGAAIANRRLLGPAEARVMLIMGLLFSAFAIVSLLWPKWVTVPMAVLSGWLAISLLIRAYKVRTKRKKEDISSGLIRKARFRIVQRKKRKGWRSKKQENVS
jgi:cardiolipin synthase